MCEIMSRFNDHLYNTEGNIMYSWPTCLNSIVADLDG